VVVVAIVVVVVVVHMMCAWSQTPFGSQPAVVQGSLSESGHGVLSGRFGNAQMPVIGLHTPGPVQGLLSSAQVVTIWFWSQPLTTAPPVARVPLHPAVVHRSLSVSVQGVLVGCGVCMQVPIVRSQLSCERSLLSSQLRQSGIELDSWPLDVGP